MSRPGTEGREANPWTQPDETLWSQRTAHPRVRTETWGVHPQSILNPSSIHPAAPETDRNGPSSPKDQGVSGVSKPTLQRRVGCCGG
ncbi:hypothetical protein ACO22_02203 [Paracoccidioides brasiliensis]|uniref:Uncharacterized protein n=1 Tax=Paracoccidioides brasiliensis TaxID=121759 RepID=A0A1D2JJB9_PARBR|nr:hypothetical protein ACO22_02203 [Paracoccidioides brasiliensis]